jgi:hypothetical protein
MDPMAVHTLHNPLWMVALEREKVRAPAVALVEEQEHVVLEGLAQVHAQGALAHRVQGATLHHQGYVHAARLAGVRKEFEQAVAPVRAMCGRVVCL